MGIFSPLLDILFPPRCVFCAALLYKGSKGICPECLEKLPLTGNHASQKGQFYSLCVSPLYYEDDVRESLLRYKFKSSTGYAEHYGKLMAECVRKELSGRYDFISWVPLSKKRLKERGYDQARLLAEALAGELDAELKGSLEKTRNSPKQSTMGSPEKRRANISGAYRVTDRALVEGKRILLIDDIITSGSTLAECARMLRQSGAAEVVCATVARSRE